MALLETTTELTEHQGMICVMNQEGDSKLVWDRRNDIEVENARRTFASFKDKGFAAYSVKGEKGEKGEVVREFNPAAERIIFAPPMIGG